MVCKRITQRDAVLHCNGHRRFLRLTAAGAVAAVVPMPTMSLVAFITAAADWRFASTAILPRAVFASEFAPLSHMHMNGFFFSQGLDKSKLLFQVAAKAVDQSFQSWLVCVWLPPDPGARSRRRTSRWGKTKPAGHRDGRYGSPPRRREVANQHLTPPRL